MPTAHFDVAADDPWLCELRVFVTDYAYAGIAYRRYDPAYGFRWIVL